MTKDSYAEKQLVKAISKVTQYKNQWLEYTLHRSYPKVQLAQEKVPNISHQGMQDETTRKSHCIPAEWWECGATGVCQLVLSPWERACQFLIKVNICLPHDSVTTSTDTTKRDKYTGPQQDLCKNILIVPNWELPKYPSTS